MRILQLSKFYPPVPGGIESVVHELTEGLNRHGLPTDVLCANTCKHTVKELADAGYRITRAASLGKLLSTSMSPALLRETAEQCGQYDVIHVHLPDPMTNLALWLCKPRARIVVHWHSDIVHQRLALKAYAPLQQWLLERADAIIATSPPYAASSPWLQAFRRKVHVVPIGIRDPAAAPVAEVCRVRTRHADRRIVFALGRMTYYKGFDVLIDAAQRLPKDVVVVIGGGGELLEPLRQTVRQAGLDDRVQFVGRLPDAEIRAYYEASSVFCLPSTVRAEAFGVVLLEAMAAGRAIVATEIDGSGVPWVNEHGVTGVNVPPRDSGALAKELSRLLERPDDAAALGRAGRERFERCFTADAMIRQTSDLYANTVGAS